MLKLPAVLSQIRVREFFGGGMGAEGPQQNDGVITSIASGRISSPRFFPSV